MGYADGTYDAAAAAAAVAASAAAAAEGGSVKQKRSEMQLLYYVGVARGTTILVDFGKHRKVLSHVLSGVLAHVPEHVSKYSLVSGSIPVSADTTHW